MLWLDKVNNIAITQGATLCSPKKRKWVLINFWPEIWNWFTCSFLTSPAIRNFSFYSILCLTHYSTTKITRLITKSKMSVFSFEVPISKILCSLHWELMNSLPCYIEFPSSKLSRVLKKYFFSERTCFSFYLFVSKIKARIF